MLRKIFFMILIMICNVASTYGYSFEEKEPTSEENVFNFGLNPEGTPGNSTEILPFGMPEELNKKISNRRMSNMDAEEDNETIQLSEEDEEPGEQIINRTMFIQQKINMTGMGGPDTYQQELMTQKNVSILENIANMGTLFSISGNVGTLWEKHTLADYAEAFYVNDLDGDNKQDVLVFSLSSSGMNITANFSALRGIDGSQLWMKSITGDDAWIWGIDVKDMTGDGKPELLLYSWNYSATSETINLAAIRGYDGYELWSRSITTDSGYIDFWISINRDYTGDNLPDVIIETRNWSATTETISATGIRGYDGKELWNKSVTDDAVRLRIFQNRDFTGDGLPDVIIKTWNWSATTETISATGIRGYDGKELWSRSVTGDAGYVRLRMLRNRELTGDGLPDVIIETRRKAGFNVTATVTGLQGRDGKELWNRSASRNNESVIIRASIFPDITGDGLPDVVIRTFNGSRSTETESATGIRGNDGKELWNRSVTGRYVYLYIFDAGDLNGDGINDVVIGMENYYGITPVTVTGSAIRGYDGYQFWNISLAGKNVWVYVAGAGDLDGDGRADILAGMGSYGGANTTTVTGYAVRGYDGHQFWDESITGADVVIDLEPGPDVTGDGNPDVALLTWNRNATIETYNASAVQGDNGSVLFSKLVSGDEGGTYLWGIIHPDVTGDNLPDVIMWTQSRSGDTVTANVTGIKGNNGNQLWTKTISGDAGYTSADASIQPDLTGDNLHDIIVNLYARHGKSEARSVTGVQGNNGRMLWTQSVSGDAGNTSLVASLLTQQPNAPALPVSFFTSTSLDFTGDELPDVVIKKRSRTGSTEITSITGLKGNDGMELWKRSVSGDAGRTNLYYTFQKLTADKLPDVIIETRKRTGATETAIITALRGKNGKELWTRSVSGIEDHTRLRISTYHDLTGDNLTDVIIETRTNTGINETENITGLQGNNGRELWTKSWSGEYIYIDYFLTDWDGDGLEDILIMSEDEKNVGGNWIIDSRINTIKSYDGSDIWNARSDSYFGLSVTDFDNDGKEEVIVNTYNSIYALAYSPASLSILINNGTDYTNSTIVDLTLATSGATEMSFRNDAEEWGPWEPFSITKSWTLSEGDGTKSVYFKARNNTNEAGPVNDITILDTIEPTVANISVNHTTPQINDEIIIMANISDANLNYSGVFVSVKKPDGIADILQMESSNSVLYNLNYDNTSEYGRYDITILAYDLAGNINNTEKTWFVTNMLPYENESVNTSANDGTEIDSIDEANTTLGLFTSNDTSNERISVTLSNDISPEMNHTFALTPLGKYIEVNASKNLLENITSGWVVIKIYYTGAELEESGLDQNTLKISWYDDESNPAHWEILAKDSPEWVHDTGVAPADIEGFAGYVWANISHLSTFGLVGSYPEPTTQASAGSSSGSTGGGGFVSSGEDYINIEVNEKFEATIYKDKVTSFRFTDARNPILYVNITCNVSTEVMRASIESLKDTSTLVTSTAPGIVYKNANIWIGAKGFAVPENINNGIIAFRVENSWINNNNLAGSDIKLLRWDGAKWLTLETILKDEDSTYTYFESSTNTFSPFAITGLKEEATVTPVQAAMSVPTSLPTSLASMPVNTKSPANWVLIIGVILVICIVVALYIMKKGKSR